MPARPPVSRRLAHLSPEERKQLAIRLREIVDEAKERKCADCGNWYARKFGGQMTFDHLDATTKLFNIGTVGVNDDNELGHNLVTPQVLREEIVKCDVVCRACHTKREKKRATEKLETAARERAEEERQVWRGLDRVFEGIRGLWILAFRRFETIVRGAWGLHKHRTASRRASQTWEAAWNAAIGAVLVSVCRGFVGPVFFRPRPTWTWRRRTGPRPPYPGEKR